MALRIHIPIVDVLLVWPIAGILHRDATISDMNFSMTLIMKT